MKVKGLNLCLLLCVIVLMGCASVLHIGYTALPNPNNLLKDMPKKKIRLIKFTDERVNAKAPDITGAHKRKTYGQIYDIKSDRDITAVVMEAVAEELKRSGHQIVEEDGDTVIGGKIRMFWITSMPTSNEDWNITAEVEFLIITRDPATGEETVTGPFYGKEIELRYIEPDTRVFKRMIEKALAKAVKAMSSNTDFASTLK